MRIRRKLTTLLVAAGLVAGATGTALAAPSAPSPEQQAARCERATQRLGQLEASAAQLAGQIEQIEATLASGELTARQTVRAQQRLARLQERLANLDERIGKLGAKLADACPADTGGGGTGGGE